MKKIVFLFLLSLSVVSYSQTTSIPDANFEQALIDLGYDTGAPDGSVPTANIQGTTVLNLENKGISSLN